MSFVLITAIVVSILMIVYLGKRWQVWFNFGVTGTYRLVYWLGLSLAVFSLILPRLFAMLSTYWLPLVCNILFGFVLCVLYVLIIFDLLKLLTRQRFKPQRWTQCVYVIGVIGLFLLGHHMATSPAIVNYHVKIDKPANLDHLRIVQLSDIHINELTQPAFIDQLVDDVNSLNPDLIFITGDTIDNRLKPFISLGFDKQLQNFKSRYGAYIIFGNHEYLSIDQDDNHEQDVINAFKRANLHVLKDDILYDDNLGITFIGRDDLSAERYGTPRASLSDLVTFTDSTSPIILLDHQPKDLDEPANLGVDLMVSGHTHGGQIFPVNLIVDLMYQNPRGMYHDLKRHFTSIVSSGYGLWGPPIRLMTRSEIVVIDVSFNQKQSVPLLLSE